MHNICYSTFVEDDQREAVLACPGLKVFEFTNAMDEDGPKTLFVQTPGLDDPRAGALPGLQALLKAERGSVRKVQKGKKKQLKTETDPDQRRRLEIEILNLEMMQLAVKLCMNSIYGFLGAPGSFAYLPNVHCASAITESGRLSILASRDLCLGMTADKLRAHMAELDRSLDASTDKYCRMVTEILADNPDFSIRVIGGDTDSVFLRYCVRLRCDSCHGIHGERACRRCYKEKYHESMWAIGFVLAEIITQILFRGIESMVMEMEKFNSKQAIFEVKKKYIGFVHYGPTAEGKVGGKGNLTVRGDTIPFIKDLYQHKLCPLLLNPSEEYLDRDVCAEAMDIVHDAFEMLVDGKNIDVPTFAQRKKLSRPPDKYKRTKLKNKDGFRPLAQHVQVAQAMQARTGRPVEVGSYIRWVLTVDAAGHQRFEELDYYCSLPEEQRDPLNFNAYIQRMDIVKELVNSFLEPDVFKQLVRQYQNRFQKRNTPEASILSYFGGKQDKKTKRKRIMARSRCAGRKSTQQKRKKLQNAKVQRNKLCFVSAMKKSK